MAISSVNMYNPIRITGLSSGMDTDSMVQDMLQIEQMKLDDIYKNQTREEWKYESYEDVNKMLSEFRNKYMSALSDDNMWSSSAYKSYSTNIESNPYIQATATSTAFNSEFTILAAKKASYASISSDSAISRTQAIGYAGMNSTQKLTATVQNVTPGKTFEDLGIAPGETFSFSINGSTFTFDSDEIVQDAMDEVNAKTDATNVKMSINDVGQVVFESEKAENADIDYYSISGGDLFGMTGAVSTRDSEIASDLSTTLGELSGVGKMFEDGSDTATVMINNKSVTFNKTDSIADVLTKVNAIEGVSMTYVAEEDRFTMEAESGSLRISNVEGNFFDADGSIGMNENSAGLKTYDTVERAAEKMGAELNAEGKLAFTINGVDFEFDADTKLEDMMNKVNTNAEAGVVMTYSEINDRFTIRSAATGATSTINISGDAFESSGAVPSFFGISTTEASGTDSSITFEMNGSTEVVNGDSNTFTLDGVEFTITQDFNADPASSEPLVGEKISFAVSQSTDDVVEKMESFVEDYNNIISVLNGMINEEKDYDYDVLTQEEREALTEEEIEQMDEKARAGTMRNDDYITGLLYQMRSYLYQEVGDTGYTPSDIGLSTGSYDKNGEIEFDKEKFEEALRENPEVVSQVMAGTVNETNGDINIENSGLMSRLFEGMTGFESNLKTVVMESSKTRITDYEEAYEEMVIDMYEAQERYYAQFTQMETLLSQYDQQSSWLTQQLGGL